MSQSWTTRRAFIQVAGGTLALAQFPAARSWSAEEKVTKRLKIHEQAPFNAEPPLADLLANPITPVESFYVRNHGKDIPGIKLDGFHLDVSGLVDRPLKITLAELVEKFKVQTIAATLTCAGNRRIEHSAIKAVSGVPWEAGAIGHALWQGVSLAEVLSACGLKPEAKHVWFEGLDEVVHDGHATPFGGSVPLSRVMKVATDAPPALLAHRMNGAPLLPEHGFPLRTVVPGFIGARSVKWLSKIVVSDRPSPNYFLDGTYKLVQGSSKEEVAAASPIYENVVNSVICQVKLGASPDTLAHVAGYAIPSGQLGAKIAKVEVSTDGGKSWQAAKFDEKNVTTYGWVLWSLDIKRPSGDQALQVRATDTAGQSQPESPKWNAKGYLFNGWHRAKI